MKYFGTDGIRRNSEFFTEEFLFKIADAAVSVKPRARIVIARDPRVSGPTIQNTLTARLVRDGASVVSLGMTATPVLAYYTRLVSADLGIMISASHNPPEYNGVKFFDGEGRKISEALEEKIEALIDEGIPAPAEAGGTTACADGNEAYIRRFSTLLMPRISPKRVLLDTANGAASLAAPALFKALGCETKTLFVDTCGTNINCGCGATAPEAFLAELAAGDYEFGFCFDGDGDRLLAYCGGKLLDGDHLMYIFAKYLNERGELGNKTLVGTVMTNLGAEAAVKKAGFILKRAAVGDKYIAREMAESGAEIGGEASGHVIVGRYQNTGDALLAAALLAAALSSAPLVHYDDIIDTPQISADFLTAPEKIIIYKQAEPELLAFAQKLGQKAGGRLVIRASGTEPKIRIMAEAPTLDDAQRLADVIRGIIVRRIEGNAQ